MSDFRNRMNAFMSGRRGNDELTRFLSAAALVLVVLNILFRRTVFYYLFFICLIYTVFRMMSRNTAARARENEKFLSILSGIRHPFKGNKKKVNSQSSGYRFFRCPGCGQVMRAPEGKGRIRVTCSGCGKVFETEV